MSFDQGIKRMPGTHIGIRRFQEPARYMMAEIDGTQFPNKLVHVCVFRKLAEPFGLKDIGCELLPPLSFHCRGTSANFTLDIIKLEQCAGDRTTTGKTRATPPAEPVLHHGPQTPKALGCLQGRLENDVERHLGHALKYLDLKLLLRFEVRKKPAFRYARSRRELPEGYTPDSMDTHLIQTDLQQALFGGVAFHRAMDTTDRAYLQHLICMASGPTSRLADAEMARNYRFLLQNKES